MIDSKLLHDAGQMFQEEPNLIKLPKYGKGIFVGDTHGDLNATEIVLDKYLKRKENTLVFLGDYVDRGRYSEENVEALLKAKVKHPKRIYLLMGNHEGMKFEKFRPANFWEILSEKETEEYGDLFAKLPLVAQSKSGIISLHGALPDVTKNQLTKIKPGTEQWESITWGDFMEIDCEYMGLNHGRPTYGKEYFDRVMEKLGKEVLIRSHQPDAAGIMFDNRCLTIFTSHAYHPVRTIAVANLEKEVASVDDLDIIEI